MNTLRLRFSSLHQKECYVAIMLYQNQTKYSELELYIEDGFRTPLMLEYRNNIYNAWLVNYRKN
jgi:hypothetical protein